jgi:hypothetical protein
MEGILRATTWDHLRIKQPIAEWWKLVWFFLANPRHSFILWLVFKDALVIKHRMCRWGYVGSFLCVFCDACHESPEHLFFQCSFNRRIWRTLMVDCSFFDFPID